MYKLIGAVLIIGTSSLIGVKAAGELKRRAQELRRLSAALRLMSAEISDRLSPMREVMRILSKNFGGETGRFCSLVENGMAEKGFSASWDEGVGAGLTCLHTDEKAVLYELSSVLGQYDAGEQSRALSGAIERTAQFARMAEEEVRIKSRLFVAAGMCAGVFAVTVLL